MTKQTEALKLALEALNSFPARHLTPFIVKARQDLRQAIEQAEQAQPVAWLDPWTQNNVTTDYDAYGKHGIPLYTSPPAQRTWVGLTDNEVLDMARTFGAQPWPPGSCVALGQMIEAKLREKNA